MKRFVQPRDEEIPEGPFQDADVTTVVALKKIKGKIVQDCNVYIGRRVVLGGWNLQSSKWGNPFRLEECDNSIEKVLAKYEHHVRSTPELWNSLYELSGKCLGCWCKKEKPTTPCHGDVLVKLVKERAREEAKRARVDKEQK